MSMSSTVFSGFENEQAFSLLVSRVSQDRAKLQPSYITVGSHIAHDKHCMLLWQIGIRSRLTRSSFNTGYRFSGQCGRANYCERWTRALGCRSIYSRRCLKLRSCRDVGRSYGSCFCFNGSCMKSEGCSWTANFWVLPGAVSTLVTVVVPPGRVIVLKIV